MLGLLSFTNGFSQTKKEIRKAELDRNYQILDSLFQAKRFVLEADYLQNKYGDLRTVPSTTNFIMVDTTTGILQTANYSGIGYNGLGGVTAEGNVGSWILTKNDKRLSFTVKFNLSTNIGFYDVFLTVNADNNARATISGLGSGKLTYNGHISTIDNSNIFKGTKTY